MLKDRLILFGVAGMAAVATAGWMRQPIAVPVALPAGVTSSFQPPAAMQLGAPAATINPVAHVPRNAPAGSEPNPRYGQPTPVTTASSRRMPVAYDDRGHSDDRSATIERQRSTKESIAIVAGSAAAGAAIGGIAGGGKGAAIGALAGGGAGAVYDRMTAKKRVPADYGYRQTGTTDDAAVRQGRSTAERIGIIGGGAAAGAAIGGLAGGGKGAAIGALGGGAAGYIYDRMTGKK
jgi:hypothetical protein